MAIQEYLLASVDCWHKNSETRALHRRNALAMIDLGFLMDPDHCVHWRTVRQMPLLRGIKFGKFEGQYLGLNHIGKARVKRIWYWLLPLKYRRAQLATLATTVAVDPYSHNTAKIAIDFMKHLKDNEVAGEKAAGNNDNGIDTKRESI